MFGIGAIDEVQLVGVAGPQTSGGRGVKRSAEVLQPGPHKRRKGTLPKDFKFVSPSSSPAQTSPTPSPGPLSPAPAPVVPAALPACQPPPLTVFPSALLPHPGGLGNGVMVPGLGTVYPGGKMAAFRSMCSDGDTDTDAELQPLVIMEEVATRVGQGLYPSGQ